MATTTQFRVQAPSTIPLLHLPLHLLPRFPRLLAPVLVVLLAFCAQSGRAALLQGCDFGDELCDPGEVCIPDGLFGQCYSDPEAALIRPLILDRALKDAQSELLRSELGRLAEDGLDWPHARSQCVLAYFKLTVAFQLDYDKDFCAVRDPANIWALVQRVQNALLSEEEENEQRGEDKEEENGEKVEETGDEEDGEEDKSQQQQQQGDEPQSILLEGDNEADEKPEEEEQENGQGEGAELVELIPVLLLEPEEEEAQPSYEMAGPQGEAKERRNETKSGEEKRSSDEKAATSTTTDLAPEEQAQLDKLLHKMLENKRNMGGAEAGALNQHQLARLVQFVRQLQNMLLDEAQREENQQENEEAAATMAPDNEPEEGESAEEEAESTERDGPVLVLKKDTEQFDNADMGLAHTVHKIVKGGIQRVEGNRVYLRVAKENLTEEELYKLITYLDRKIASPNRLYFDQFLYQDGQLSFRISRALPSGAATAKLGSASGVAQAVYKRRKDIQTLAGVRVDETGIGSGQDVVPVERSQRDQLFFPILAVCGLTICALLSVLAASLVGRYRRNKATAGGPLLPQTIDQLDSKMYEQLCRQRTADSPRTVAVVVDTAAGKRSKTSSTSSWPGDEPPPTDTDLDIGTGHVLLAFLQKHLDNSSEMDKQWQSVRDYAPQEAQVEVAKKPENLNKNLDPTVLPYDDSRVKLRESGESDGGDGYVNASAIYDSNPEHPAYIAAQAPVDSTVAQFWQMIWEQGIGLLVNLCDQQETSTSAYTKYWPEEGSKVFGVFEIHLVSEHIWSEHYVVRSLYLKNTGTQETRTVTQFHFPSWPANGVPNYSRALLEFRRKVNKSYRGRASPVLVHCTNGGGRTGTYILIDTTINRIQKGIKELNIAASLEHLRDQRMGMVENEQQFKCVFSCVADEVSSLLKGLQH